jgi:hypothetical protein
MDVDPMEFVGDDADEAKEREEKAQERKKSQLNAMVAVTVALLATFMAICSIKDGNIVQNMQQAQAKSLDYWAWYQARKIRVDVAKGNLEQIRLQVLTAPATARPEYEKAMAALKAQIEHEKEEAEKTQKDAQQAEKDYDSYNYHDDQFDATEALLSLAVSLLAVTSLTQKRFLYFIALVPTAFGLLFGLAGLCSWKIHPDLLAKFLS